MAMRLVIAMTRMLAVRQSAHQRDQHDPRHQPHDLRRRLARRQAPLQLRNQIGQRDVDEAAAGQHQKVRQPRVKLVYTSICDRLGSGVGKLLPNCSP